MTVVAGGDVFTGAVTLPEAGVATGVAGCDSGNLTARCGGGDEKCSINDAALRKIEVTGAACAFCGGNVPGLTGDAASASVRGTEAASENADVTSTENKKFG